MARSRYSDTPTVDGRSYASWTPRTLLNDNVDILHNVRTVDHVFDVGDRLDIIAAKQWGQPEYWWVIALCNAISFPLGISPGTTLKIPLDVKDILDKLLR